MWPQPIARIFSHCNPLGVGEENEENPESWKKKRETKQENAQEKEEYEQREKQQVQKEIDEKGVAGPHPARLSG